MAWFDPGRFVHLHHANVFYDVQLGVLFDERGKVSQIYFVGNQEASPSWSALPARTT